MGYLDELRAALVDAADAEDDAADRLAAIVGAFVDYGVAHPAFVDCAQALMGRSGPELLDELSESALFRLGRGISSCLAILSAALERGVASGDFDVEDPTLLANTLYASGLGALQLAQGRHPGQGGGARNPHGRHDLRPSRSRTTWCGPPWRSRPPEPAAGAAPGAGLRGASRRGYLPCFFPCALPGSSRAALGAWALGARSASTAGPGSRRSPDEVSWWAAADHGRRDRHRGHGRTRGRARAARGHGHRQRDQRAEPQAPGGPTSTTVPAPVARVTCPRRGTSPSSTTLRAAST